MQRPWLATIALLLLPSLAAAEQLDYGLRTQGGWTDNVYGTGDEATVLKFKDTDGNGIRDNAVVVDVDPINDYSLRVSPWGELSDKEGNLTWSAKYTPSYEYYLDQYELRDFDHDFAGQASWRMTEQTTLYLTESLRRYKSLQRFNENAASPADPVELTGRRQDILGNYTAAIVRHAISPRDVISLNLAYNLNDYQDDNTPDRDALIVASRFERMWDERLTFGLTGNYIRQTFDRVIGNEQVTDYYNLSPFLEYQFDRTLRIEASAGPTLIDSGSDVVNFLPLYGVQRTTTGTLSVDATECLPLNDALPVQEDPNLPGFNPYVAGLNFSGCGSGDVLQPGELELLGYPQNSVLVPGGGNKLPKFTEFGDPYEFDANTQTLKRIDTSDVEDLDVTYFARLALIKDWELWHLSLAYERSNDDSGSIGSSSVQDSFEVGLRWEPHPLWSIGLTGAYTMVEQASDAVVPNQLIVRNEAPPAGVTSVSQIAATQSVIASIDDDAISYESASLSFSATRRLTPRSSVFAALYWYEQQQTVDIDPVLDFVPGGGGGGGGDDTNTWSTLTLWLGVEWHFDTYKF